MCPFTEDSTVSTVKGNVVPDDITKPYSRSRGTAPLSLNLSTRWRSVVNLMCQLLYLPVNRD